MRSTRSKRNAKIDCGSSRRGPCDSLLALLTLFLLTRGSLSPAEEIFSILVERPKPDLLAPFDRPAILPAPFALPANYELMGLPELKTFPAGDFRLHGTSIVDKPQADVAEGPPMLRGSTVWQRLLDFRSQSRVRLLTLWETGGSSVSLQAGKKGEPSLQWTSRSLNRGGATRGVFDRVFSVSVATASRNLHSSPRAGVPAAATNAPKPADGDSRK